MTGSLPEEVARKASVWRVRILTTTWLSYAGFYFCRKNFFIAKSSLLESLQIDKSDLAHIVTAYLVAYMLGQFLTAFWSRRVAARVLLLAGMGVSLGCNVIFGFSTLMGPAGYWPLLVFMVVNGFAQATGWPGNVGVLGNWLPRRDRGRVMALWATCYQLGSVLAKGFAAFMIAVASAAWSFWGAALILFGVWILFFLFERDDPQDVGLPGLVEEVEVELAPGEVAPSGTGWSGPVLFSVLSMGCCYFVFKFLRYALDSWSPLALEELFGLSSSDSGYVATSFDWMGFVGVLFAGWASDRYFAGRRYQIILLMSVGMAAAFIGLAFIGVRSPWLFAACISMCGFMLMGPDSLLSGVGAIEVGGHSQAVVAAGIINGLGSVGPIFQEEMIGYVLDNYGYDASFHLLIAVAMLGVFGTLYLAHRSRSGKSSL